MWPCSPGGGCRAGGGTMWWRRYVAMETEEEEEEEEELVARSRFEYLYGGHQWVRHNRNFVMFAIQLNSQ
jgi:hypothetical protein